LENPEATIQSLCSAIGIPFDTKMLQIPITGSSNTSDISSNTGIDASRLNQWEGGELNNAEISICQEINSSMMQQFGYVIKNVDKNAPAKFGYKLILPFQLILTAMVNVKRWKHYWRRVF
jgi:hypothetical protein